MLKRIKSNVIIKKIFLSLKLKVKLKMINYNKSLQRRCSVDINIYKKNAKKYIEKDEKGNNLIFSPKNNFLVYKGGYVNGKKQGFGKEFALCKIKLDDIPKYNKQYLKELNIDKLDCNEQFEYYNNITFTKEK